MLDYLNDENDDLLFENGDLVIGESTKQHQKDILMSNPGDYRQSPEVSVGVGLWVDDDEVGDLPGWIRSRFEFDGMTVNNIEVTASGKITSDAEY